MPTTDLTTRAAATAAEIAVDADRRSALQRRTLIVVVISQVLGGAGLAAGITTGALLARQMLRSDSVAGLPAALFTLGAALAAYLIGRISQRRGRRLGLGSGFVAGGLGAIGVVTAAVIDNPPLLFVALFVYGAGIASNLQARYAGTDLAQPNQRGKAVSIALVSTTLGAVAGPNLVQPTGRLAASLGMPTLAGPFLLAAVAYLAAGAVLLTLLRPDPFLVAKHLPDTGTSLVAGMPAAADPAPVGRPGLGRGVLVGATVMVLTQVTMIAIMTMTPIHMRVHHHDLGAIGLVIGMHVGAMYLPSLITGILVDKVGRIPMAIASGATLLLAGLTAAVVPGDSLPLMILALVLLGIGWNFGLISGTALIVDATTPRTRAGTQGTVDVLIALGGAGGGAASGVVVGLTSFTVLGSAGGLLALLLIPVVFWYRTRADSTAAH